MGAGDWENKRFSPGFWKFHPVSKKNKSLYIIKSMYKDSENIVAGQMKGNILIFIENSNRFFGIDIADSPNIRYRFIPFHQGRIV